MLLSGIGFRGYSGARMYYAIVLHEEHTYIYTPKGLKPTRGPPLITISVE